MLGPESSERRIVRFGTFEVDFHSGELWKSGLRIPLQEQPFRLLAALLKNPGELITREQLKHQLWADDTFVDFERGLNTAVKRVRDALGDDADTPRFVETLPRRGYRFIAPVIVARDPGTDGGVLDTPAPPGVAPPSARWRAMAPWYVGGVAAAMAVAAAGTLVMRTSVRRASPGWSGVARLQFSIDPAQQYGAIQSRTVGGTKTNLALSPDGRALAFVGVSGDTRYLFLRRLDRDDAVRLAGTAGAVEPFFSPDGGWIGFWSDGYLRRISVEGGQAATVCEVDRYPPMGATWVDTEIVFATALGSLLRVPAAGGKPVPFSTLRRGEFGHRLPHALPGSRGVLFTVRKRDYTWGNEEIAVQSLDGGPHTILLTGTDARYVPSGHIVFLRLGTLLAAPFDLATQKLAGTAVPILNDVAESAAETSTNTVSGAGQFTVSDTGVLAYVRGGVGPKRPSRLLWLDRQGRVSPVDLPVGLYIAPRLSPDGNRVAWFAWETTRSNIWIHDFERGWTARLGSDEEDSWPMWSRDGRDVVYQSVESGEWLIKRRAADGTGASVVLTSGPSATPTSWSPDGQTLAVSIVGDSRSGVSKADLYTWRTGGRLQALVKTSADEDDLQFSPVSQHYAYVSDESGQKEVYVATIDDLDARVRISTDGGDAPAWSTNGRELFYVAPSSLPDVGRVMVVDVSTVPKFRASMPRVLFQSREAGAFVMTHPVRNYDVSPDGRRFLTSVLEPLPPDPPPPHIDVVLNWVDELRAKAKPGQ